MLFLLRLQAWVYLFGAMYLINDLTYLTAKDICWTLSEIRHLKT